MRCSAWYRTSSGDKAPDPLVDFYKCYRAVVRWKIELLQSGSAGHEYRTLAEAYRDRLDPRRLILIGGLSGSGKTVLATALAERLKCLDLHTDDVRRQSHGTSGNGEPATDHGYAAGKYSATKRAENYQRMLARAAEAFDLQRCIILDGTFTQQRDREAAQRVADKMAARHLLIWCTCPEYVRKLRIEERMAAVHGDSEILPDHLQRQALEAEFPAEDFLEVDTMASLPDQLEQICHRLSRDCGFPVAERHGQSLTNTR